MIAFFFFFFFNVDLIILFFNVDLIILINLIILLRNLNNFYWQGIWPEIRKLKKAPSEFWPISGDLTKLGIPNLILKAVFH